MTSAIRPNPGATWRFLEQAKDLEVLMLAIDEAQSVDEAVQTAFANQLSDLERHGRNIIDFLRFVESQIALLKQYESNAKDQRQRLEYACEKTKDAVKFALDRLQTSVRTIDGSLRVQNAAQPRLETTLTLHRVHGFDAISDADVDALKLSEYVERRSYVVLRRDKIRESIESGIDVPGFVLTRSRFLTGYRMRNNESL